MNEITLKCKFITPAFIYGSNDEPELRVPSIKGLMRFWWRATYKDFTDIEEMKQKESEIFGGPCKENGEEVFKKAKVKMTAKLCSKITRKNQNLKKKDDENNGYNYLYYSMISLKDNKTKEHFPPGTEFEVSFIFDKKEQYIFDYLKAFNILQLFGGIGGRSRRGGGNFVVMKVYGLDKMDDKTKDKLLKNIYIEENSNDKDLLWHYKDILKEISTDKEEDSYSNIYSKSAKITTLVDNNNNLSLYKSYKDALKVIGDKYSEFRGKNNHKLDIVVFGLPCKNNKKKYVAYKGAEKVNRRQSPLSIKIIKYKKKYGILLIKFAGKFLKEGFKINNKKEIEIGESDLIDEFLKKLIDINDVINIRRIENE